MDKVKTRYVPGDVLEAFRKAAGRIERFAFRLIGLSQLNPADVVRVSLLSMEEYEVARDIVPKLDGWWWLRSPGPSSYFAAYAYGVGGVNVYGTSVAGCTNFSLVSRSLVPYTDASRNVAIHMWYS